MKTDIQARNFSLTDAQRSYVERRLRFALTCSDDYIRQVVVRLFDSNDSSGDADKRCVLRVVLAGLPNVVIENTEADLYVAIGHAVDRAGRAVARRISREQIPLTPPRPFMSEAV